MKILFLGYDDCLVLDFLRRNHEVFQTQKRIKNRLIDRFDYVICFGYRYIIPKEAIERAKNPIINLHISFLPWNRGAESNFWSFYDDTPKGVSIHIVDEGVDTGPILIQKEVEFDEDENTLELTYNRLISEVQNLFIQSWDYIISGDIPPKAQIGKGSYHSSADFKFILPNGWKTRLEDVPKLAHDN